MNAAMPKPIEREAVRSLASVLLAEFSRFVETALRHYGNVLDEAAAIYEDAEKRIVRVTVTDLETNWTRHKDVLIRKTVERAQPRVNPATGEPEFFGVRLNSRGGKVYEVAASDDDLLTKEGSLVSKALRTIGEKLIPVDIKEEALQLCRETLRDRAAKDPDAERKAIVDGFARLNVGAAELKTYLAGKGKDLASLSPEEMVELRKLWNAIRDGETTWSDEKRSAEPEAEPAKKATDRLKEKLA
jgi:hypothetical protein